MEKSKTKQSKSLNKMNDMKSAKSIKVEPAKTGGMKGVSNTVLP